MTPDSIITTPSAGPWLPFPGLAGPSSATTVLSRSHAASTSPSHRPRRQQTRQCRLLPVFHTRRRTPHSSSTLIGSRPTASPDTITQTSHYVTLHYTTRNYCTTDQINNIICALLRLSFRNPAVSHTYLNHILALGHIWARSDIKSYFWSYFRLVSLIAQKDICKYWQRCYLELPFLEIFGLV